MLFLLRNHVSTQQSVAKGRAEWKILTWAREPRVLRHATWGMSSMKRRKALGPLAAAPVDPEREDKS